MYDPEYEAASEAARDVALAAAHAAKCAAASDDAYEVFEAAMAVAKYSVSASYASIDVTAGKRVTEAVWHDYEKLFDATQRKIIGERVTIPRDVCGPLWPLGTPAEWP